MPGLSSDDFKEENPEITVLFWILPKDPCEGYGYSEFIWELILESTIRKWKSKTGKENKPFNGLLRDDVKNMHEYIVHLDAIMSGQ